MEKINLITQWLNQNKEWLFSGVGISILGVFGLVIKKLLARNSSSKYTNQNEIYLPTLDTATAKSTSETEQIVYRFNEFLDLLNQKVKKFTIAQLAQIMQLKSVGELERIFKNQKEPDFEFIKQFCKCFFLNEEWLINGKGQPFILDDTPRYFSPDEYLKYFTEKDPSQIYFIMSKSEMQEAFLILKYEEWQYEIIQSQWHISSHVGGGGSRQLYGMYKLIKSLQENPNLYNRCAGFLLSTELFKQLYEGSIFPANILSNNGISYWWDDLTDIDHKRHIAPNYSEWYGQEFIRAQNIIRSQIEKSS